jgi:hypothetical protein
MNRHRASVISATKRQATRNVNDIFANRAINDDARLSILRCGLCAIDNRHPCGRWAGRDATGQACAVSGLDEKIERVVVQGKRRYFRAVVFLQIIPFPARADGGRGKVTFIANKVTFDAPHAGAHKLINERL